MTVICRNGEGETETVTYYCIRIWLLLFHSKHVITCRLRHACCMRHRQAIRDRIGNPEIDQPHTGVWYIIKVASQIGEERLPRKRGSGN